MKFEMELLNHYRNVVWLYRVRMLFIFSIRRVRMISFHIRFVIVQDIVRNISSGFSTEYVNSNLALDVSV